MALRRVYLDYNATTPLHPKVRQAMEPWMSGQFGNPSSMHSYGRPARAALDEARERMAKLLGSKANEIIFTSGGTEADNLAIIGVSRALKSRGRHLITSCIEHHAVLAAAEFLQKQEGFEVTYLPVDSNGLVAVAEVSQVLRSDTILVSVMMANNETGTLQPVAEIGRLCRERGVLFHTDAVQAVGKIPVSWNDLNVDLLSLAAHKFYGPKGVGALVARGGVKIDPLQLGGAQEMQKRAGTENLPGIVGMVKAAELAAEGIEKESVRFMKMTERLWEGLSRDVGVQRNGHPSLRVANTLNVSFQGAPGHPLDGEALLMNLDLAGIAVSSGSACIVGTSQPSHVLRAMGRSENLVRTAVRFSLGSETTEADINYVLENLPPLLSRMRNLKAAIA